MNPGDNSTLLTLGLLVVFSGLIAGYAAYLRIRKTRRRLRNIPAFTALIRAIGLSVEAGTRLHISLGSSDMSGEQSAAGLAGASILNRVAQTASISDQAPVVSAGEGTLAILSQDILSSAFREMEAGDQYDPALGRLTGATPFSYAAGAIPLILDEQVSTNILAGQFGPEIALIAEAAERNGGFSLAGSDQVATQALIFAAAQEPLIGEELFAAGAYLKSGIFHDASLWAQDMLRWFIVLVIIGLGVINFLEGLGA